MKVPFLTQNIPAINASFKNRPEDFIVEEIPSYLPLGFGNHLYLWVEKTEATTHEAVSAIAKCANIPEREFGYAGLKDRQSVSRQWLSLPWRENLENRLQTGVSGQNIKILKMIRHGNKIKVGHLLGNRFQIRVTLEEDAKEAFEKASLVLRELEIKGCPNVYTGQRFGLDGQNAAKGKALLLGQSRPNPRRKTINQLMVSAYQSELFNRILATRMPDINILMEGDVAQKEDNGACFLVKDVSVEQLRASAFEISPTGPIFGYKMMDPQGIALTLEEKVLEEEGIQKDFFKTDNRLSQKGARRSLRFKVSDLQSAVEENSLLLSFACPKGCYATAVLRELLKKDL